MLNPLRSSTTSLRSDSRASQKYSHRAERTGEVRALGDWNARMASATHLSVYQHCAIWAQPMKRKPVTPAPAVILSWQQLGRDVIDDVKVTCGQQWRGLLGPRQWHIDCSPQHQWSQTLAPTMPLPRRIVARAVHGEELQSIDSDRCPVVQHVMRSVDGQAQWRASRGRT